MCADPLVMQFIGDGKPLSIDYASSRFEQMPAEWNKVGYGVLAIERKTDRQFLGFAGLSTPDVLPQLLPATEIGWRIRSEFWGNGYGTEGARAVADWAFNDLGRKSLLAIIREDNKPSIRIAEKLNMTLSQTINDHRYLRLLQVYELAADAWQDKAWQDLGEN